MKKSLGPKPLAWPLPVFLVGTYDENGRPNIMNAGFGGLCSIDPPAIMVSIRPATWTHSAILANKAFTVSIPGKDLVEEADYVGLASGRDEDKFQKASLSPIKSELVNAPYVGECPAVLECELIFHHSVGSHTLFVGKILDVKVEESVMDAEGLKPDVAKIDPLCFDFAGFYNRIGERTGKAFSIGKKIKGR